MIWITDLNKLGSKGLLIAQIWIMNWIMVQIMNWIVNKSELNYELINWIINWTMNWNQLNYGTELIK